MDGFTAETVSTRLTEEVLITRINNRMIGGDHESTLWVEFRREFFKRNVTLPFVCGIPARCWPSAVTLAANWNYSR